MVSVMWLLQTVKRLGVLMFLVLGLAGCSREQSAIYWIEHPERLRHVLENCERMPLARRQKDPECRQAFQVAAALQSFMTTYYPDHLAAFGQKIIENQVRLVELQEAFKKADTIEIRTRTKAALKAQQMQLNELLAMAVLIGEG